MTRVGVLPLANCRSSLTCAGVQVVPEFRVDFDILGSFLTQTSLNLVA